MRRSSKHACQIQGGITLDKGNGEKAVKLMQLSPAALMYPYGLRAAIKELPDGLKGSPESALKGQLVADFDTLKKKYDPIIMHRCKRIAHNDRTTLTGEDFLPGIGRAMMREALTDLSDLYNKIGEARGEIKNGFSIAADMDMTRPCETLFKVLDAGNARLDEQRPLVMNLRRGVVPDGFDIKDLSDT
jgi:hypothetical protein